MEKTYFNIKNRGGSVEHYFHFLLGFLVPLVEQLSQDENQISVVRSCGPLDRIVLDLPFTNLEIIDASTHKKAVTQFESGTTNTKIKDLLGFDDPRHYDRSIFQEFNRRVRLLYSDEINQASTHRGGSPRVVLINRSTHEFYRHGGSAEIFTSGIERRSIPNFSQIEIGLKDNFPLLESSTLEDKSLPFQIALFDTADIIIAQHGAALANLIFCRPGTKVIEVLPPYLKAGKCFQKLAACLNLEYCSVPQENEHSAVELSKIYSALNCL